jgi:hypothetical protein
MCLAVSILISDEIRIRILIPDKSGCEYGYPIPWIIIPDGNMDFR